MKDFVVTISVLLTSLIGFVFSIMLMYSLEVGSPKAFEASIIFVGLGFFLFSFLVNIEISRHSQLYKWFNILMVSLFLVLGLLLSMICIFAPPVEGQTFSLAGGLFLLSSVLIGSGLFVVARKIFRAHKSES